MRFGVQRLAITDARAAQPLVCGGEGHRIAIAFNGNLADPGELRESLAERGHPPRTRNDAELALLLYRAEGVVGLEKLGGQFAFAIADEFEQRLVLARDRFGEKPLFVADSGVGGQPCFASTVAALDALTDQSKQRDQAEMRRDAREFATRGFFDPTRSCMGLPARALTPGTIAVYERDGRRSEHSLRGLAEPDDDFESSLATVVAARTASDRPIGLFLSGGLDSALLASQLARDGHEVVCFSLDFEGGSEEGERAQRIAEHLQLRHVRARVGAETLDALQELVVQSGLPVGDPSILAVRALARVASERGVAVILGGEGADELFRGYRRMRAWPWIERARTILPARVRRVLGRASGASGRSRAMRALHTDEYSSLWSLANEQTLDRLFGVRSEDARADARRDEARQRSSRTLELEQYLTCDLLPKLDLGGHSGGVEARAPYLDARLAAHAFGRDRSVGESFGKVCIRRALAGRLPKALRTGRKRGFGPPIASWLYERRDDVRRTLGDGADCFDVDYARSLLDSLDRGPDHGQLVFCLTSLALHLRACA